MELVGIVNVTEDSFSDGGRYLDPDRAIAHASRLRADGADLVELGAASSHPDARSVSVGDEQRRLVPVLEALAASCVPVSVDSTRASIQRLAIAHGARLLNDVRGFPDPSIYEELAASDCRLVVMHSVTPGEKAARVVSDPAIWTAIDRFFSQRIAALVAAGVSIQRLVLDPGLGFFLGANPEPSVAVLGGIARLHTRFGLPVMVSPSRKSFLRALTGRDLADISPATLAAELHAARSGVDFIRTHDVRALGDALKVAEVLRSQEYPEPANTAAHAPRRPPRTIDSG